MPTTFLRAADATEQGPERTVRLRVVCAPMPPKMVGTRTEIELAMQYLEELRPGVEREDGSMQFECEVRVKRNPKNGNPNFLGRDFRCFLAENAVDEVRDLAVEAMVPREARIIERHGVPGRRHKAAGTGVVNAAGELLAQAQLSSGARRQ